MRLAEEAESLLLYQFKDAPRLKGLLRSLIQPLQSIADDICHFSEGLHIDEVSEHWLDILGELAGQKRSGMSDNDMRSWVKIRIMLNRCHGTPEELLIILKLLLGHDYQLTLAEHKPKDVVLVFFMPLKIKAKTVFALIKKASPLGLKHHFINAAVEKPFRLDEESFLQSQFADFFKEDFSR